MYNRKGGPRTSPVAPSGGTRPSAGAKGLVPGPLAPSPPRGIAPEPATTVGGGRSASLGVPDPESDSGSGRCGPLGRPAAGPTGVSDGTGASLHAAGNRPGQRPQRVRGARSADPAPPDWRAPT